MNADLVRWLFERKAIFALVAIVCLTVLRFTEHLADTTFGLCFSGVVAGFLTASVLGDKALTSTP